MSVDKREFPVDLVYCENLTSKRSRISSWVTPLLETKAGDAKVSARTLQMKSYQSFGPYPLVCTFPQIIKELVHSPLSCDRST
eukprot:760575-Hanusia_phi.AAC.2